MICESLFSEKNKNYIISLSSDELAHRVVKVNASWQDIFMSDSLAY